MTEGRDLMVRFLDGSPEGIDASSALADLLVSPEGD